MRIVVYAVRYTECGWEKHRHICNDEEMEAVVDSAKIHALMRLSDQKLCFADYLAAASYIFNVARGPRNQPVQGDTEVTGLEVSGQPVQNAMDFRTLLAAE